MRCTWNADKNLKNLRKHGFSLELAARAFDDPHYLTNEDYIDENGEMRYQTLGLIGGELLIVVAHVFREESDGEYAHLISARKAIDYEKTTYWSQHH